MYNIKDPCASRDPMITPEEWEREMSENRYDEDCNPRVEIMPVALDGFTGLKARMDAQARAIDEFQAHAVVRFTYTAEPNTRARVCACACSG